MSAGSALVKAPDGAPARRAQTPAEVKAELHAAREKVKARLVTLEGELGAVGRWREVVRRHPVLAVGGVFVAGYLLGRWWGRR
ncbi:MAG: hypothetical protein INH41_15265 [Myxococcaceae bacterium]|nr:hypothetical protein [Myxococcaceae bacterium]